jgi:hypothetical protein
MRSRACLIAVLLAWLACAAAGRRTPEAAGQQLQRRQRRSLSQTQLDVPLTDQLRDRLQARGRHGCMQLLAMAVASHALPHGGQSAPAVRCTHCPCPRRRQLRCNPTLYPTPPPPDLSVCRTVCSLAEPLTCRAWSHRCPLSHSRVGALRLAGGGTLHAAVAPRSMRIEPAGAAGRVRAAPTNKPAPAAPYLPRWMQAARSRPLPAPRSPRNPLHRRLPSQPPPSRHLHPLHSRPHRQAAMASRRRHRRLRTPPHPRRSSRSSRLATPPHPPRPPQLPREGRHSQPLHRSRPPPQPPRQTQLMQRQTVLMSPRSRHQATCPAPHQSRCRGCRPARCWQHR